MLGKRPPNFRTQIDPRPVCICHAFEKLDHVGQVEIIPDQIVGIKLGGRDRFRSVLIGCAWIGVVLPVPDRTACDKTLRENQEDDLAGWPL